MEDAIPKDIALKLCEEIRSENLGRWYSISGICCGMCSKVSRGDTTKLCFSNRLGNRRCLQVNKRYQKIKSD